MSANRNASSPLNTLRVLAVVALAIVSCIAISAFAQEPTKQASQAVPADAPSAQPAPPQGPGGGFRPPSPPILEAIDANRDGELNDDEITKASEALQSLDKDKDGEISAEESAPTTQFFGGGRGGRGGPGGRGGFGGPGARQPQKVLERFDANKDRMLNADERAKARADLKEKRAAGGGGGRGPGGGPFGGRGREGAEPRKPGKPLSPSDVATYPDTEFYAPNVLRTLFFEFENKDWEEELEDFHDTDVDVPARLIADGKTYENVGLRFRGASSYGGVPRGQKRSLNVTIDLMNKDQRVMGYKTLNLLNSHTDPSFLRAVLYNHVARKYIPAPQANLVRVVINGESWGVYVNEEQFNKDFVKKWFIDDSGPRWKVPPNFSGAAALVYQGDKEEDYRGLYELKSKDEPQAWQDLIALCKTLKEVPDDQLETELDRVLNLDRALWFLALDNVFIDDDGYFSRGSDYSFYQDATYKRFHLLPRDSNETFRFAGGGPGGPGGRGGPGGPGGGPDAGPADRGGPDRADRGEQRAPGGQPGRESGAARDPLAQSNAENRPLLRRLMANKNLKARYLAHVRTIVDESLDWRVLEPVFEEYRALIADDVIADTRNLSNFAAFFDADIAEPAGGGPFGGPPGIKRFVEERRKYLLENPELTKQRPTIVSVVKPAAAKPGDPVQVVAEVAPQPPVAQVILYYADGRGAPFKSIPMNSDRKSDGGSNATAYSASIPQSRAGADLYYYVEARAGDDLGTTAFYPAHAETGALVYRTSSTDVARTDATPPSAKESSTTSIAINEVMAANTRTIKDPQGKFDDWIELVNSGSAEADLSGMYLTDDSNKPRKWKFPKGTSMKPGEHLLIWADEDGKDQPGLHANFKLSKNGETLLLVDSDERGNAVLDTVEFTSQRDDIAFGRHPDRDGKWQPVPPTPGQANVAK